MSGWIKLYRKMLGPESSFQKLTPTQQIIAIQLVMRANHKDGFWKDLYKGEMVEVKRGEIITSEAHIAEWFPNKPPPRQIIRSALNKLQHVSFLTKLSTKRYTHLKIVNYELYQKSDKETNQDDNQVNNQDLTKTQPRLNQDINHNLRNLNNSSPNGEGGQTAGLSQGDVIWGDALNLLLTQGMQEQTARSFLGFAAKKYGRPALEDAIATTLLESPAEAKSFILKILKESRHPEGKKLNASGSTMIDSRTIKPAHQRKGGEIIL